MEVRFSPFWLQLAYDAWLLGLLGLISWFYRFGV